MCCRYKEMSRIKDLMSLSCSLNFFSASSKASSLIWKPERSVRECTWHFSEDLSWNQWATCGEIPVRCLRWLLTLLDFLIMECMLSLEIFSMNVSSSPFLYFTTMDSRGSTIYAHANQLHIYSVCVCVYFYLFLPRSFLRLYSLMFTLISLTACRASVSWGRSGWLSGVAPRSSINRRG